MKIFYKNRKNFSVMKIMKKKNNIYLIKVGLIHCQKSLNFGQIQVLKVLHILNANYAKQMF